MYEEYDIREMPLSLDFNRRSVERFLAENGLRLDGVETYVGVFNADEELVGGGGLEGEVIKCVAVSESERGTGLMARIVSRLQSVAAARGHTTTMVFTKPGNLALFRDLGYVLLAEAPEAILMESSPQRLFRYQRTWQEAVAQTEAERLEPVGVGVIVMNANPFTRGHQYLVEQAARQVGRLVVMVVSEERSAFPFAERLAMVKAGTAHLQNVCVVETGPYAISAATFPTYFLKELSTAAETQMQLDLNLFRRHVAPALGASVRFVGTEPADMLTCRYNELMKASLLPSGLRVVEIERLEGISASKVRDGAWLLVPGTSLPYVLAHYACCAMQEELDLTPKPGLVDRHDSGAHSDMDYALMSRSIRTLRPYFREIAEVAVRPSFSVKDLQEVGLRAERAMLEATGGVNTHRGALFCLGLAVAAAARLAAAAVLPPAGFPAALQEEIRRLARQFPEASGTHGAAVRKRYPGVKSALQNACEGFSEAFDVRTAEAGLPQLLAIMSRLDDTNILYRCGAEVAEKVRQTAVRFLCDGFTEEDVAALNEDFSRRGISPGGAADMYALCCFLRILLRHEGSKSQGDRTPCDTGKK
ncbi:MAG: [Alloprevotella sp.]|nr:[citrate (pro-3S)-lyase] ligase [Alloprevotella sp.]